MPFVNIYVHLVWSTKNRFPFLKSKGLRDEVWKHMKANANVKGIFIDTINGYADHCHCLISLGTDQTISKTLQLIKGESSYWINKEKMVAEGKFEWQDEYFAASVSKSMLQKTRNYILNQEAHHASVSFKEEYKSLLEKWGFSANKTDK